MKWLLLAKNTSDLTDLLKTIENRDKESVSISCTFSKNDTEKWVKALHDVTDVAVLAENSDLEKPETAGLLYSLAGYCTSSQIPFLTDCPLLEKNVCGSKDNIRLFKNKEKLIEEISSNYSFLSKLAKKQLAAKTLLNKGIPFTSDCFADYISKGKFEICRLFLSAGMDINTRNKTGTPMLNIAVRTDNEEIVSWLIDNGAEINVSSEDRGYSPVMDAVWRGNKEITEFLVNHGAELNTICKEGQSNLVLAVGGDKTDIVKILAEHGADPDIKDAMGMSAWEYAKLFKKEQIISILEPYHKD